jgi:hypothetical protein
MRLWGPVEGAGEHRTQTPTAARLIFHLRALTKIGWPSWGVAAPARQGARRAHTGGMQATNNAGGRDAPAAQVGSLFWLKP